MMIVDCGTTLKLKLDSGHFRITAKKLLYFSSGAQNHNDFYLSFNQRAYGSDCSTPTDHPKKFQSSLALTFVSRAPGPTREHQQTFKGYSK